MDNVRRFLQQHGLAGLTSGKPSVLGSPPDPEVGHGLHAAAAPDLETAAREATWYEHTVPRFQKDGYELLRAGLRLTKLQIFFEGGPLEFVGERPEGRSLVRDGVVFVDLDRFGGDEPFAVITPDRRAGLYFEGGLVAPLERPLVVSQPADVASPARELAEATDDPWISERVRRLLAGGGALAEAAAMGFLARYRPLPEDASAVRAMVTRLVAGATVDDLDQERAWARQLTAAQLDTIDREGNAQASGLYADLEALREEPDPESEAWRAGLARLYHGRDALEGVRVLLVAAGSGARLRAGLRILDAEASIAVRAMPRTAASREDLWLLRASTRVPEGWWTWAAVSAED